MKAYVITSGVIFGLLAVAHLVRIVFENRQLAIDPIFILFTVATAGLSMWAWLALSRASR